MEFIFHSKLRRESAKPTNYASAAAKKLCNLICHLISKEQKAKPAVSKWFCLLFFINLWRDL